LLLLAASVRSEDAEVRIDLDPVRIQRAAERGLRVIEKAARSYPEHRDCFSCHHQTLPMLAMAAASERGLAADLRLLGEQANFTHRSFAERAARMHKGEGVGGTSMTVGYGLWTLAIAGRSRDETTDAMVAYLLLKQEPQGPWRRFTSRPPLEDSDFTCTVLAVHYLRRFAGGAQRAQVEEAAERAGVWLRAATPASQEDLNSRLGGLRLLGAPPGEVEKALRAVLEAQRTDGGWAQLDGMASDAYATGQTLFTLARSGISATHEAYRRGLKFLLDTQSEDGSWRVETRSKPIQVFFDNGDPHGEHQFISVPGTAWATTALALALPPRPARQF
jgi:N-acyl-D-amino-acid deacylase